MSPFVISYKFGYVECREVVIITPLSWTWNRNYINHQPAQIMWTDARRRLRRMIGKKMKLHCYVPYMMIEPILVTWGNSVEIQYLWLWVLTVDQSCEGIANLSARQALVHSGVQTSVEIQYLWLWVLTVVQSCEGIANLSARKALVHSGVQTVKLIVKR